MAIYRVIKGHKYTLAGVIEYACDNILHDNKILFYNGFGVDPENPLVEMLLTKKIYNQKGGKEYYHVAISLEENERPPLDKLIALFNDCGNVFYEGTGCQVFFVIHDNTQHLHCHFIINNLNLKTGKKLNFNYEIFYNLRYHIDNTLVKHGLKPTNGFEFNCLNPLIRERLELRNKRW